ncbi:ANTAR domain-containing protein [Streptomyces sp. NPDC002845]
MPLRRGETVIGALNVFLPVSAEPPSPEATEGELGLLLARQLADAAATGLDNQRLYSQCRNLAAQLQHALTSRVYIEQAKGVLAERWGSGVDEAFVTLRQHARSQRLPLDQVAKAVIERSPKAAALRERPPAPS